MNVSTLLQRPISKFVSHLIPAMQATRVRKKGPVLERLQKKIKVMNDQLAQVINFLLGEHLALSDGKVTLQANQNNRNNIDEDDDEMSKMMTTEQAEIENAGLPEGYRYVLVEELTDMRNTTKT